LFIDLAKAGAKVFDELNVALDYDPPSAHEKVGFSDFVTIGIDPRSNLSRKSLPNEMLQLAAQRADQRIREADYSTRINGWKVNFRIVPFIEDPLLRASVNRIGPGAHIAQEALYFGVTTDRDGKPLNGGVGYRIRFPKDGLPPVDAFWSLILYGPGFALVENPIGRYAITDRTAGLKRGADGSIEIVIQNSNPKSETANWLPAPRSPFSLILRTYQPRLELFDGRYNVPPVETL
jgi:hypothetical protein